jgi:thioredoxin 1
MAINFSDESAKEAIASGKPVVIDVWAEWCGPCKALAPVIEELSTEYEGKIIIGKYNADENSDIASEYLVSALPTILMFKEGKKVDKLVGFQPKAQIESKLKSLL